MSNDTDEHDVGHVVALLEEIADESGRELGRPPTSRELFEILTWGLRSTRGEVLADVMPAQVAALEPVLRSGVHGVGGDEPADVQGLNDASFVLATELFADMADAVRKQHGGAPTLATACEILVQALARCDDDMLSDVAPKDVVRIEAERHPDNRGSAPRIGDVVAIPLRDGSHALAVVLADDVFGVAYGLFRPPAPPRPLSRDAHPPVEPHPVYSSDEPVAGGRWRVVGHDKGLVELFPRPEIFHRPDPDEPDVGPHGAAETASGELRALSREEAEAIGVLEPDFRQTWEPDALEEHLSALVE
jgi:hypothetical protein